MKRKLLDQVRDAIRLKHYSIRTEQAYIDWIKRYIYFFNKRHPKELGEEHIQKFLTHLAVHKKVAASTQNQALNALIFLYKYIIKKEIRDLSRTVRAKKPIRLPVVLTKEEVKKVITSIQSGNHRLIVQLLYGAGLRLIECLRLRIQDLDFDIGTITVRSGKGEKDRITILPESLILEIKRQIEKVRHIHENDLKNNLGETKLPYALKRKYPNAGKEFCWQYIFPASKFVFDKDENLKFRYHIHSATIQKAVKKAVELRI